MILMFRKQPLQTISCCVLCNMTLSQLLSLTCYDECQDQGVHVDMGDRGGVSALS